MNSMRSKEEDVNPTEFVTSVHLRQRAHYYRLAAAVTDNLHDVEMFNELAAMFDSIASSFLLIEAKSVAHRTRLLPAATSMQGASRGFY